MNCTEMGHSTVVDVAPSCPQDIQEAHVCGQSTFLEDAAESASCSYERKAGRVSEAPNRSVSTASTVADLDEAQAAQSDAYSGSNITVDTDCTSQASEAPTTTPSSPLTPDPETPQPLGCFSPDETIMIFDWDDTLLPSTWLTQHGLRLDEDSLVTPEFRTVLDQVAALVKQTLLLASTLGTVIIITNAETGWVELSCKKFMPSLCETVQQLKCVSARSTFEPKGVASPFDWKVKAFEQEIELFYSDRMMTCRRNIISFGDSAHEREAVMQVTRQMDSVAKSLKFVERPDVEQLKKEHELIIGYLRMIAGHDQVLDLCIRWDS